MDKSMSSKYGQRLLCNTKKSEIDAFKTASKRTIQKTTEENGDLTENELQTKLQELREVLPVKLQGN